MYIIPRVINNISTYPRSPIIILPPTKLTIESEKKLKKSRGEKKMSNRDNREKNGKT